MGAAEWCQRAICTKDSVGIARRKSIGSGERHEIWLDERRDTARSRPARLPDDRLAAWADEAFRADEEAYMRKYELTPPQAEAIRKRLQRFQKRLAKRKEKADKQEQSNDNSKGTFPI